MINLIDTMNKEELVAKCKNQRVEINHLLNQQSTYVDMCVWRGTIIRQATKHLKAQRIACALSTLTDRIISSDAVLRELANDQEK